MRPGEGSDTHFLLDTILTFRKRSITQGDPSCIREVITEHGVEGRSANSRRLCEIWNWRQTNGQLKDVICRGLLLQLERSNFITLPPRKAVNNNLLIAVPEGKQMLATGGQTTIQISL